MLPEPRYAEWKPVAIRRWPTAWAGFLVGVLTFIVGMSLLPNASLGLFMISALVSRYVAAWLANKRMASLRDDLEGGQFVVTIRLMREVTYGYDEGLLAFEDGWLVYSGRRCAFSLPASAIRLRLTDKSNLSFGFGPREDERTAFITTKSSERFLSEALIWRNAQVGSTGTVALPPSLPNETAYGALRTIKVMGAFAASGLLGALLTIGGRIEDTLAFWLILGFGVPLGVIYVRDALHSLQALALGLPRRTPIWPRAIAPGRHRRPLPPEANN